MEKSARTISKTKFCKQPVHRRHKVLAELAREFLALGDYPGFLARYEEMHAWSELDRYRVPHWLEPEEALRDFARFHEHLSGGKTPADEVIATSPPAWEPRFDVEVVLDQVRTPFNCGSVLRLIDNFGFRGLVHATPHFNPKHPQMHRAARGSEHWLPIRYEADLPAYLQNHPWPKIGIEAAPEAVPLPDWDPPPQCLLIVGNETYGIARRIRALCDQLVAVPTFGFKNSMNLSHALAVVSQKIVEKQARLQ
ncbi:MAG: TrmH family RNA methyltransferase [Acidobacteriota bacterium]|nr:TrmH family RNA methyltransferase [Acidobacteriota bacterium]